MEFWGVEVKPGEPVRMNLESDELESTAYLRLSQAALGESKKDKGSEPVVLYLTIAGQKFVLGTLIKDKVPQILLDVVIEKDFELSHNWKNGSVFLMGCKQQMQIEEEDGLSDDESEDEDIPLIAKENGKPDAKTEVAKAAAPKNDVKASGSEKQVKVADPKKNEEEDSENDEDEESDDEGDESGSDEDMLKAESDSDSDSEDDGESDGDEDDEETPPAKGKKRPNDSAVKTPVSAKKAKSNTPQKTDSNKGVHSATPHPSKKAAGKTPNSQAKVQTPKSGGQLSCKSCSKTFTSEAGLQQHSKVKHGGQ